MAKAAFASYNAPVMVELPPWIPLVVGVLVVAFGAYRMRLAFRSQEAEERARERGGLYGMARRTHFLVGLVYLLMGAMLVASAFGVHILPKGK
jgi:hypothetical protein